MADVYTVEQITQTIGIAIGVCTLGVFVWRVSLFFWKKSKCFDALKNSVRNTEERITKIEDKLEVDLAESKTTHIEIFKRMNENDKKLSYLAGKFGFKEED